MKTQNGLPSSSVLEFPQIAAISRFLPAEVDEQQMERHAEASSETYDTPPPTVRGLGTGIPAPRGETWSQDNFLRQLQREKRRAERTKCPLSIVLYRVTTTADGVASGTETAPLLQVLHHASRETDIIGYAGGTLIAVLCPDTDQQGVAAYVHKVEALAGDHRVEADMATYPDQLFEDLTSLTRLTPELQGLVVDENHTEQRGGYRLKRWLDVAGAAAALLLLSPLMLLVALLIAATSPGPVIFKQIRLGRGGVPFSCYKFRSMVVNGDDNLHRNFVAALIKGEQENQCNPASAQAPVYKIRSDPRITWIGRIIRKTSIDELPQLFNVLKGEMSLVGPRPPIPYEAENYQAWHLRRILSATPGITGLWQVEGRSSVTFNEMVRLDLRYIRECSFTLDLKILLKTVGVVIRCEGAA